MGHERIDKEKNGFERGARVEWDFQARGSVPVDISIYEGNRFECHFHAETELTLIREGEMYYQAGNSVFLLHAGDAVFVNAEVMHAGWQKEREKCLYQPVNFSVAMISGFPGSRVGQNYVEPILREGRLPFLVLRASEPADAEALACARRIADLLSQKETGYELLAQSEICRFWYYLYTASLSAGDVQPEKGTEAVKKAIRYMEENYAEKITLQELSDLCGLSRSEFCRTFHKFTGRTPFTYLQHLRVRRSLPLLFADELSITDIAERCGFAGGSYYAEVFRRFLGVSPLAYRKKESR